MDHKNLILQGGGSLKTKCHVVISNRSVIVYCKPGTMLAD